MRIVIAAVGRLKQGPERELAERYRKRAADAGRKAGLEAVDIVEIRESRAGDAARRMLEESIAIANIVPERAITVLLDERGESMGSGSFAGRLQGWRTQNKPAVCSSSAAPMASHPACARRQALPSPSDRPLGRISWFESCCWSSSTAPSPSWRDTRITAGDPRKTRVSTVSATDTATS